MKAVVEADRMQTTERTGIVSRIRLSAVLLLAIASLAWTVWRWNSLDQLRSHLGVHALIVGIAIGVSEALFVVGALILAHSAGQNVFGEDAWQPWRWIPAIAAVRRGVRSVEPMHGNRGALAGLYLNWFGALGSTGLIPIAIIATMLPIASWGLMTPFVFDVLATCAWRRVLLNRFREEQ
jgi:hypothetical protein